MNSNGFEGFVLAGGKSSRMKTDKAFLKFGDETFLERAVKALAATCGERVKVVINRNQKAKFEKGFASLRFVFDLFPERGALGGIHAALKNCERDWALVLACDLPFVNGDAMQALARIALDSAENIAAIVPKQSDGRIQPLCAAYRVKDCLDKIEKLLIDEASPPARRLLEIIPVRLIEPDELTSGAPSESLFFNVNRPSDFEKAKGKR
jgi:molybdopterin-guanine dinucleotide biosynthesis protein A